MFVSLGRQLAEFCQFPRYTRDNVSQVAVYEGFENFDAAERRGKGVLFLTAHLGGMGDRIVRSFRSTGTSCAS